MVSKKTDRIIKIVLVIAAIITVIGISYALLTATATGEKSYALTGNNLKVYLDESKNLSDIMGENTVPVADYVGESGTAYTFSIVNDEKTKLAYNIYLVEDENSNMTIEGIRYNLIKQNTSLNKTDNVNTTTEAIGYLLHTDTVYSNTTDEYELRLWMGEEVGNEAKGKTFSAHIEIEAVQVIEDLYVDDILNGTDPVLTDNLIPVKIDDTGKVTKADVHYEWYNYSNNEWANAIVLKDQTETYNVNQEIPEEKIESYFVWIPKYSYQLWDLGNYSSVGTTVTDKTQEIKIRFGTTNTNNTNANECVAPEVAGETGKCIVGDYMTHPAFLAFENSTGFWTGKFETGFSETTAPTSSTGLSTDISKIIIKPNVYSWRYNTTGNMFKLGYDYLRSDESHMMKNTEWGAVAYLQHSAYGSQTSIRINNNSKFITGYAATEEPTKGYNAETSIDGNRVEGTSLGVDGTHTLNYKNAASQVASTTGNYSGIYDMSGSVWEVVMGYTTGSSTIGGSSEITSIYSDFFTNSNWNKYYDKYSTTTNTNYKNRILGDATGEMGPFFSEKDPDTNTRNKNSWYKDYSYFPDSASPWFNRGGNWNLGTASGAFAFSRNTGSVIATLGFRIVLTPTK